MFCSTTDLKQKVVGAVLAAVSTVVVCGAGSPASAAPMDRVDDCGVGVCWYNGYSYLGNLEISPPQGAWECVNASGTLGHYALSVFNKTRFAQRVWTSDDCTGQSIVLQPGQGSPDLGFLAYSLGAA